MKPFFWRDTKNFGDYTNYWLWPKLIGDLLSEEDNIRLVGIGSLLKSELNFVAGKKIIFGSGSGYGSFPPLSSTKDWVFYFVRGPLTAAKFGLAPDKAIVDGAWLISLLPDFSNCQEKAGISFIPHWKTAETGSWEEVCASCGFNYINPVGEFEEIIKEIAHSSLVITESLHGAVFADLFRTPWIPVKIAPHFLNFKWIDWCKSIDVPFKLIELPPSNLIDCILTKKNPIKICPDVKSIEISEINKTKDGKYKKEKPFYYHSIMKIKKNLKPYRTNIYITLNKSKNNFFTRQWNDKLIEKAARYLNSVSFEESFLSEDCIKNEKLERLSLVVEKLRTDYRNGVLLRHSE